MSPSNLGLEQPVTDWTVPGLAKAREATPSVTLF